MAPTSTAPGKRARVRDDPDIQSSSTPDLILEQDGKSWRKARKSSHANKTSTLKKSKVPSTVECVICLSEIPEDRLPKLPHPDAVGRELKHPSEVCFDCWDEHLRSEVESKAFDSVECPQCRKPLVESEIRELASEATYQEYLDKAAKQALQQEEEYHACPNAECSWGAYFVPDDGNISTCPLCKSRYCSCEVPFHENATWEGYLEAKQRAAEIDRDIERRKQEEAASEKAVKEKSRPCPRCGVNIDKYTGCDHVTCE